MTGRFAGRARSCALIPAVCTTIAVAACTGTASSPGPTERVPAAARVLMVTYGPGTDGAPSAETRTFTPVSVAITDRARVRQVASLINGLPLVPADASFSCPAYTGGMLHLAFRRSPDGRTLAAGEVNVVACPDLDFTSAEGQQYLGVSGAFTARIMRIAGIRPLTH